MPITSTKLRIPLGDGWDLVVVNSGRNSPVILSLSQSGEEKSPVHERISLHLTQRQAIQLARALAGVTYRAPILGFDGSIDEEEDTKP